MQVATKTDCLKAYDMGFVWIVRFNNTHIFTAYRNQEDIDIIKENIQKSMPEGEEIKIDQRLLSEIILEGT